MSVKGQFGGVLTRCELNQGGFSILKKGCFSNGFGYGILPEIFTKICMPGGGRHSFSMMICLKMRRC